MKTNKSKTLVGKIRKYLYKSSKVKRLPPGLINPYRSRDVTNDEAVLLSAMHVKDRQSVDKLLKRHDVETVDELIDMLPSRVPFPNVRRRAKNLWHYITGTLPSDPAGRKQKRKYDNRLGVEYLFKRD